MRNWVLTAYSAGTVSFCSGKALMGRRRSAKSSGVGTVARARIHQSEGTLPFPFDPEGTDVMVLEAKAHSNVTVRSPCRVEVVSRASSRSFEWVSIAYPGVVQFGVRGTSRVEKTQEVYSEHLSRLEDERDPTKRLGESLES